MNPEVAHEQMAGTELSSTAVAQAWEAGKLFHIDLNDQDDRARYDQDFRFGSVNLKAAFFLVKFLEDVGYRRFATFRRARVSHRGLRRREGLRARLHADVSDPQRKSAASGITIPRSRQRWRRSRRRMATWYFRRSCQPLSWLRSNLTACTWHRRSYHTRDWIS